MGFCNGQFQLITGQPTWHSIVNFEVPKANDNKPKFALSICKLESIIIIIMKIIILCMRVAKANKYFVSGRRRSKKLCWFLNI